jgi:DNA invertase Pin-like site-specific DNA recombinase
MEKSVKRMLDPTRRVWWGGYKTGVRKGTEALRVLDLISKGLKPPEIQHALNISRPTYYRRIDELGGAKKVKKRAAELLRKREARPRIR